jgi:hypothetical protein
MLKMLKALTLARARKKLKTEAMPELMSQKSGLLWPVVELLFLLPDPALLMPTSPLL